ncbi:MAG: septal ring lytic transglycosylase RlpA family protein, partial [Alphaproteobacteria bacterium]
WSSSKPRYSPRAVQPGHPVPKGGGRYKLGSPYRIKGKTYVPKKISHYDRTGVASWYGKDFHGRYTANGEVYNMEALTAAHTTLPLPCYVRVTNLKNGRSLVLRVNDRGPYAHNRLIDLSWAAASLLDIERAGTGHVRVKYLRLAPLDGNDRYERNYLAQQPWAGPRVAQAASPAKAMRYLRGGNRRYSARKSKHRTTTAVAAVAQNVRPSPRTEIASAWPAKRVKRTARLPVEVAAAKLNTPHIPPMPARKPATANRRPAFASKGMAIASRAPHHAQKTVQPAKAPETAPASMPSPAVASASDPSTKRYYVEAGTFAKRATADKLAAILTEIAPTSVELTTRGTRIVHRLRLGPFDKNIKAVNLIARIRNAGLKNARILTTGGI